FQDDEGAGEKAAAYDGDALGGASLEQFAEGFFVFLKDEALQERRDQDQSLEGAEDLFDPAEDSGPGTGAGVELFILREIVPVSAGVGVMFEVVAVVEEEEIVESAVVTGGAAGVLKVPLEPAETEAGEVGGGVSGEEEFWGGCGEERPENEEGKGFDCERCGDFEFPFAIGVVGEVALTPEGLGEADDEGEVKGEEAVEGARREEGAVNEIVGDGVGGPPHAEGDEN